MFVLLKGVKCLKTNIENTIENYTKLKNIVSQKESEIKPTHISFEVLQDR